MSSFESAKLIAKCVCSMRQAVYAYPFHVPASEASNNVSSMCASAFGYSKFTYNSLSSLTKRKYFEKSQRVRSRALPQIGTEIIKIPLSKYSFVIEITSTFRLWAMVTEAQWHYNLFQVKHFFGTSDWDLCEYICAHQHIIGILNFRSNRTYAANDVFCIHAKNIEVQRKF